MAAASSGTKVARSKPLRAVRAQELIGHSNEGKSVRPLQRQSPRQRAILAALFVPPSSQPKFHPYPDTPISPRSPKANKLRGRSAYSQFLSAKKYVERYDRLVSSRDRKSIV